MKSFDLAIIGGGAAGMFAALSASQYTKSIAVLDRNGELGRKIGATGNGKCNFTNSDQRLECYRSSDPEIAERVLSAFTCEDTIEKFIQMGIPSRERKGYYYPVSEQASTVKTILSSMVLEACSTFLYSSVKRITREKEGFTLEIITKTPLEDKAVRGKSKNAEKKPVFTETVDTIKAQKLIIACGGAASPAFGTDGSLLGQIEALGVKTIPFSPALTSLLSEDKHLGTVAGVRIQAIIKLFSGRAALGCEAGEIIFNKNGISGIPILSLSRFCSDSNGKIRSDVYLDIDLLPEYDVYSIESLIARQIALNTGMTVEQALCGLTNNRLLYVILLRCGIDAVSPASALNKQKTRRIAEELKNFKLSISGHNGYENAQTTAGGVKLTEIDPVTLEHKIIKGLYFAGEILDVDGTCGGYNLQWAWTTGAVAGAYAGGGCFDKDKFLKA